MGHVTSTFSKVTLRFWVIPPPVQQRTLRLIEGSAAISLRGFAELYLAT